MHFCMLRMLCAIYICAMYMEGAVEDRRSNLFRYQPHCNILILSLNSTHISLFYDGV